MSEPEGLTREEAERRAEGLNDAAEPGSPGRWMVQEAAGGEWQVVQVQLPGLTGTRGPLTESTEAGPRPEAPDPAIRTGRSRRRLDP